MMNEDMRKFLESIMKIGGSSDSEFEDAVNDFIEASVVPRLWELGSKFVLVMTVDEQSLPVRQVEADKLRTPSWKLHAFSRKHIRPGYPKNYFITDPGDKLVVIKPMSHGIQSLSYWVSGACTGYPCDLDYRIPCTFAGGCSFDPGLCSTSADVASAVQCLFTLNTPPVPDILSEILEDKEFQHIRYLIDE